MSIVTFIKKEWPTVSTIAGGFASAATAFLQNKGGVKEAVMGGGGLLIAGAVAGAHKISTGKVDAATVVAAGSEFEKEKPQLKADLATAIDFVTNEFPSLKGLVSNVETRVSAVEAKTVPTVTTDVNAVTAIVHQVLAGLGAQAAATPATPAA